MTIDGRWIVVESSELPRDPALRAAATRAIGEGRRITLITHTPPPVLGLQPNVGIETLVVDDRAAKSRNGRVRWGRWDTANRLLIGDNGRTFDLAGRQG